MPQLKNQWLLVDRNMRRGISTGFHLLIVRAQKLYISLTLMFLQGTQQRRLRVYTRHMILIDIPPKATHRIYRCSSIWEVWEATHSKSKTKVIKETILNVLRKLLRGPKRRNEIALVLWITLWLGYIYQNSKSVDKIRNKQISRRKHWHLNLPSEALFKTM